MNLDTEYMYRWLLTARKAIKIDIATTLTYPEHWNPVWYFKMFAYIEAVRSLDDRHRDQNV